MKNKRAGRPGYKAGVPLAHQAQHLSAIYGKEGRRGHRLSKPELGRDSEL